MLSFESPITPITRSRIQPKRFPASRGKYFSCHGGAPKHACRLDSKDVLSPQLSTICSNPTLSNQLDESNSSWPNLAQSFFFSSLLIPGALHACVWTPLPKSFLTKPKLCMNSACQHGGWFQFKPFITEKADTANWCRREQCIIKASKWINFR